MRSSTPRYWCSSDVWPSATVEIRASCLASPGHRRLAFDLSVQCTDRTCRRFVPILLIAHQPFGLNAILGLLGLSGILMRNTLILIGQIHTNGAGGLDNYHAVVEATVQRARPVLLTALAAVLAFIPLTQSSFWGPLAYTLIGGTAGGTVLILVFLPALYAIWFKVRKPETETATAAMEIHPPAIV